MESKGQGQKDGMPTNSPRIVGMPSLSAATNNTTTETTPALIDDKDDNINKNKTKQGIYDELVEIKRKAKEEGPELFPNTVSPFQSSRVVTTSTDTNRNYDIVPTLKCHPSQQRGDDEGVLPPKPKSRVLPVKSANRLSYATSINTKNSNDDVIPTFQRHPSKHGGGDEGLLPQKSAAPPFATGRDNKIREKLEKMDSDEYPLNKSNNQHDISGSSGPELFPITTTAATTTSSTSCKEKDGTNDKRQKKLEKMDKDDIYANSSGMEDGKHEGFSKKDYSKTRRERHAANRRDFINNINVHNVDYNYINDNGEELEEDNSHAVNIKDSQDLNSNINDQQNAFPGAVAVGGISNGNIEPLNQYDSVVGNFSIINEEEKEDEEVGVVEEVEEPSQLLVPHATIVNEQENQTVYHATEINDSDNERRIRKLRISICMVVLMMFIIIVVVAVTVPLALNKKQTAAPTAFPSSPLPTLPSSDQTEPTFNTEDPTRAPTPGQTLDDKTETFNSLLDQINRNELTKNSVPRDFEFYDGNKNNESPRIRAIDWILNGAGNDINEELAPSSPYLVQIYALATFYYETEGDTWSRSDNWLKNKRLCNDNGRCLYIPRSVCNWHGVFCDNILKIVYKIDLSSNNLRGTLLPDTDELSLIRNNYNNQTVQVLNFQDNYFLEGNFPERALRSLHNLTVINFENNKLKGELPQDSFFESTNIEQFYVSGNLMEGPHVPSIMCRKYSNSDFFKFMIDCDKFTNCTCCNSNFDVCSLVSPPTFTPVLPPTPPPTAIQTFFPTFIPTSSPSYIQDLPTAEPEPIPPQTLFPTFIPTSSPSYIQDLPTTEPVPPTTLQPVLTFAPVSLPTLQPVLTFPPVSSPTLQPVFPPVSSPTLQPVLLPPPIEPVRTPPPSPAPAVLTLRNILENLITPVTSTEIEAFEDAYAWITEEDELNLTVHSPNVEQRFLLAYFYYHVTIEGPWASCGKANEAAGDGDTCELRSFYFGDFDEIVETFEPDNIRWLSKHSECEWAGVFCDRNDEISAIDMLYQGFTGPLPVGLAALSTLSFLGLSFNDFTGTIPEGFSTLTRLISIELDGNNFEGPFPFGYLNAPALQRLNFAENSLVGPIGPKNGNSIQKLQATALKDFFVDLNQLTGGFATEIGQLQTLQRIRSSENDFSGSSIPTEFGQLTHLEELWIDKMNLLSAIPSELGMLTRMSDLRMSNNFLEGPIPEEIYNIDTFYELDVSTNLLSGTISTRIGELDSISIIRFGENSLTGTVPTEVGQLTDLLLLQVQKNDLTGSMPDSVCGLFSDPSSNPGGQLFILNADCLGLSPQIECICCTACCPEDDGACFLQNN